MSQIKCNILIVGKSGAGKSSFCNYLFNKPGFFETGKGKPVTGWDKNFQSFRFEAEGMPIEVYDTVGLEVNNYRQWITNLNHFLNKHSRNQENPGDWIHGVFYVLNACSDRVEDLEKQLIKETFLTGADLPVQIILTNCDTATEHQRVAIMKELRSLDSKIKIHQVNSVNQRFRNKTSESFGRDAVLETFLSQSYHYIGKNMAIKTTDDLATYLQEQKLVIRRNIDNSDISVFKINKLDEFDADTLLPSEESFEEFFKYLESYREFMDSFHIKYQGENQLESIIESIEDILDGISSSVIDELESAMEKVENGNFFEKVSGLVTVAVSVLNLKKTLKTAFDDALDQVVRKLRQLKNQIITNQV
jgi:GTPase SAR1 family protein